MSRRKGCSPAQLRAILDRLVQGQSLRQAAAAEGAALTTAVAHLWRDRWAEQYARARTLGADVLAAQVLDTAAAVAAKKLTPEQGRVMIDAYKWTAGKQAPKRYGPPAHTQVTTAVVGEVVTEVRRVLVDGAGEDDQ